MLHDFAPLSAIDFPGQRANQSMHSTWNSGQTLIASIVWPLHVLLSNCQRDHDRL